MGINWAHYKQKLREDVVVLPHFFKNPVNGMRNLPHWEWPTILILQGAFAAGCSIVGNFIERDYFGLITGIIVAPLTSIIMGGIITGFFHYAFLFYAKRELSFRAIYLNVLFASIPLLVVNMVVYLVPPIILVGLAASLILAYVGFVDTFGVPRTPLKRLFIGIFVVFTAYWGFQQLQTTHKHKTLRQKATPESLDILEKELND